MIWEKPIATGNQPSPRAYHTTVNFGSKILAFGGMDGLKCFNETYILDTQNMKWNVTNFYGRPPLPRHKHTASVFGSQVWQVKDNNLQL